MRDKSWIIRTWILLVVSCFASCTLMQKTTPAPKNTEMSVVTSSGQEANDSILRGLLQKLPSRFLPIIQNPEKYRLQIIYTQINRDKQNAPSFLHHYFNVTDQYTYPASTVKLPAAVLSLEKLNRLGIDGLGINTPMYTDALRPGEKPVFEDQSGKDGKPSVGNYIKKILLVSDNDAFNRLYEFLGQEAFNKRLWELGLSRTQMRHRLSISLTDHENRTTNPVWFANNEGSTLYRQSFEVSALQFEKRYDTIGSGWIKYGNAGQQPEQVNEPLDFSNKNRWPLLYAHQLTQWIMFPQWQPEGKKLLLDVKDYNFLWKYMSMLPAESKIPSYDTVEYWPTYVKFLLTGSEKGQWMDPQIRIFNKVGDAYGHLLDAAYVVDFSKKVEFLLSAVIYCNSDGILNDDRYDYETVGFPFMKALGQLIYDFEVAREKKYLPDLSAYKFNYWE